MVKKETVRIGDKDYVLKCSVMTAETFEKVTGKQFGKTLSKYLSFDRAMSDGDLSQEEKNELMLDSYFSIQGDMMRLAYCMILEAKRAGDNQDFEYELEEWMEEVGGLDANALKGVLAVATALFPRKNKE